MGDISALNLTVLKGKDKAVTRILLTSAHVTAYELKMDTRKWAKLDIEGTLFVVERNQQPRHRIVILNRINRDNLNDDIIPTITFEEQDDFLIYQTTRGAVHGLWFYKKEERSKVIQLLKRLKQTAALGGGAPRRQPAESNRRPQQSAMPLTAPTASPPAATATHANGQTPAMHPNGGVNLLAMVMGDLGMGSQNSSPTDSVKQPSANPLTVTTSTPILESQLNLNNLFKNGSAGPPLPLNPDPLLDHHQNTNVSNNIHTSASNLGPSRVARMPSNEVGAFADPALMGMSSPSTPPFSALLQQPASTLPAPSPHLTEFSVGGPSFSTRVGSVFVERFLRLRQEMESRRGHDSPSPDLQDQPALLTPNSLLKQFSSKPAPKPLGRNDIRTLLIQMATDDSFVDELEQLLAEEGKS